MPRPLLLDVIPLFLIMMVGGIAFYAGGRLHNLPRHYSGTVIGLAVVLAVTAAASHFYPLKDWTGSILFRIGGEGIIACWAALLLIGAAWSSPRRTMSTHFMRFTVGLAGFAMFFIGGGGIQMRLVGDELWSRTTGPDGCLTQSTGLTCSPTSAVMLLYHYGIAASEGEMAYLAGTSLTGTDPYAMAHALNIKMRSRGWSARVEKTDWDTCVKTGVSFMAHTYIPHLGGHAVFVERLTPESAEIIDPRYGARADIPRQEFEDWWNGRTIRIVQ